MFRECLKANITSVTYKVSSPGGCEVNQHLEAVSKSKDKLDAVDVPDNPLSTLRVSSIVRASGYDDIGRKVVAELRT